MSVSDWPRAHSHEYTVNDEKAMAGLAEKLARICKAPLCIGLSGPLGSGKTTLARHLVKALGSSTPVSSPTFTLLHEYPIDDSPTVIEHWDLYRVGGNIDELTEPQEQNVIRLVEWIELNPRLMSQAQILVYLSFCNGKDDTSARQVKIERPTRVS